ncbi:dentin sialophosphoprotein-like isoform X2 [Dysidea avara]
MDDHLKDFSPPADQSGATNGHYSDSLSRKLERILNNHEYSDVEDADTISVQSNLEVRLAKLLDDTEDDASSRAWSAGSSSSRSSTSTGHLSAIELEDSQFEFTLKEHVQPLGVELAAALDISSHHSTDSEHTVEDEEEEDFYVHNKAAELLEEMQADGSATDVEIISIAESDTKSDSAASVDHQKKSSSAMYPSLSSSNKSDSDSDDDVCISNPSKQFTVHMSPSNDSVLSDNIENELSAENRPPKEKELPVLLEPESPSNVHVNESSASLESNLKLSSDHDSLSDQGATVLPSTRFQDVSPNDSSDDAKSELEEVSKDTNNELELVKLQLQEVLTKQAKMMKSFQLERQQLRLRNFKQKRIIKKLQHERKIDHYKLQNVVRQANMRVESVEEKMVALVEHCATLKNEIVSLDQEFQKSPLRVSPIQSPLQTSPPVEVASCNGSRKLMKAFSTGMVAKQKVTKLQKFFGESPPLLQLFLKKLGYEQYLSYFEREKIGLVELPYITEEQLIQLGIPMGPRQRILDEAVKL